MTLWRMSVYLPPFDYVEAYGRLALVDRFQWRNFLFSAPRIGYAIANARDCHDLLFVEATLCFPCGFQKRKIINGKNTSHGRTRGCTFYACWARKGLHIRERVGHARGISSQGGNHDLFLFAKRSFQISFRRHFNFSCTRLALSKILYRTRLRSWRDGTFIQIYAQKHFLWQWVRSSDEKRPNLIWCDLSWNLAGVSRLACVKFVR